MTGKGVVRSIKNYAKGFSDVQRKVREATSNDPWGPSGTLMNEIAQLTYNQHDFIEIMDMIDKRLNDKGKNWRHVFKALLLLDYCIHVGSENVVLYAKENIYVIKTLKEFQHVDDNGRDVGANVRQKAKDITSLLLDDARLKDERRQRQQMRERMAGVNDYMNDAMGIRNPDMAGGRPSYGPSNEDRELQRALEESKRMADDEERKRLGRQEDEDLQKAIRLSEQEAQDKERKQREKLERENQEKLFGSNNQSSSFNPFPANQSFDSSLNPYQQQQQWPQNTGMTNMTFSDPISANNQQLGFQNTGMTSNPYQQQQQQSNPYQQFPGFGQNLQAQMTGMPQQMTGMAPFQTSTMTGFQQPQMTGFQQPQMTGFQQSQMTGFPQQQQQQQPSMSTVSSSPMASFQQPQITAASNNPFGPLNNQQQQPQSTGMFGQSLTASPSLASSSLAPRSPSMSVANTTTTTNSSSAAGQSRSFTFPSPSMQGSSSPAADSRYAKLNSLLANKEDGMDTFGNTGNLRVPVGSGFASSLNPQLTGAPNGNGTSSVPSLVNVGTTDNGAQSNSFSDSFGQPSRNPFGQATSSPWK
ncbi:enth-domain-containing protein [Lichtheimia corymbifera JMRC:FSU:9682]|uniref:Enth-domain-containing protein n=1 Tax=Lichtheimia corymbifera JMRC:FSU:9682 TaxID=1263082 RepID=A0A068S6X6_9FUNG|nr:enth-domain-containing protein [Lichtheimia corymbifera JMRC:FSU:9682]